MQAKYATATERGSIGSSAAGRSGIWLVALVIALVAAVASIDPPASFEGAPVIDVSQPTGTMRDASPRSERSDVADLSLPRASDVPFAPTGDEEALPTF